MHIEWWNRTENVNICVESDRRFSAKSIVPVNYRLASNDGVCRSYFELKNRSTLVTQFQIDRITDRNANMVLFLVDRALIHKYQQHHDYLVGNTD